MRPPRAGARLVVALFPLLAVACGAGPYGHARTYVPADGEEEASRGARELDPVMVARDPEGWRAAPVSFFAVVERADPTSDGRLAVRATLRRLEARNLCQSGSEDTCRVTVSAQAFGVVLVEIAPTSPDDRGGPVSIGPGSLLRVVGSLVSGPGRPEAPGEGVVAGPPSVRGTWYRHWPRGYYVTTKAAGTMRR